VETMTVDHLNQAYRERKAPPRIAHFIPVKPRARARANAKPGQFGRSAAAGEQWR
jgi:hypothetical protein